MVFGRICVQNNGFGATKNVEDADLIFINTCSIRDKAEQTVRKRLTEFRKYKKSNPGLLVGVLGCMAERLKAQFIEEEKLVDLVVGPDAYRTLPGLIEEAETGQKAVNVLLSRDETYADISPIRLNSNGVNAFVSTEAAWPAAEVPHDVRRPCTAEKRHALADRTGGRRSG